MGKVKIDWKDFLVGLATKVRKIYIEDRNSRKFGKLELDFRILAWIGDCLISAAVANNPRGFWCRRSLEFGIIFF